MPIYTLDEYATLLTRAFAPHRPRIIKDVNDKGITVMEFIVPHPTEPRFSVSVQVQEAKGYVDKCSLWFGQAEISGHMNADQIAGAIEEIVSNRIVAILRYKNQDAYDNHRPSGKQWLYQLTDDQDDDSESLLIMKDKLQSKPTLAEKLSGKLLGVFEIFSWENRETVNR